MQLGEFLKINKRTVQNKRAGETSCKNNQICKCSVMMKQLEIQLSVVLKELEQILSEN